jgi:hypothetical protein
MPLKNRLGFHLDRLPDTKTGHSDTATLQEKSPCHWLGGLLEDTTVRRLDHTVQILLRTMLNSHRSMLPEM